MNKDNKKYSVVYSLFLHEKFGYLIGAYLVEININQQLTLNYLRLLPEIFNSYSEFIDKEDIKIAETLNEITLQQLYRQFKIRENSVVEFANNFLKHPQKDFILAYISRRIEQVIPLLAKKNFYRTRKDGYPVGKELYFVEQKATCSFSFEKVEGFTKYSMTIELNNKAIDLINSQAGVLTDAPAWIVADNMVFQLADSELEKKKIQPFCNKAYISIPESSEKEYFQKFLLKLAIKYPIQLIGINKVTNDFEPVFELAIEKQDNEYYNINLFAYYGEYRTLADGKNQHIAEIIENDKSYTLYLCNRAPEKEKEKLNVIKDLLGVNDSNLFHSTLSEPKLFGWLNRNKAICANHNIQIKFYGISQSLNLNIPILNPQIQETEFGFFFDPVINIGSYVIDFTSIKDAIVKRNSRIILPDNTLFHIPIDWIEELEPIIENAVKTETGWKIHPYYAMILQATFGSLSDNFLSKIEDFETITKQVLPQGLKTELREYQSAGYDWLCFLQSFQLGGILADDMGLGKTIQTLALLQREFERCAPKPSLIVVPNSLIFNWLDEIKRFTELKAFVYSGSKRKQTINSFSKYDIILTTYGTVRQDIDDLQIPFHYLILDESHVIKNKESKITQAVNRIQSNFRLSLTGTPIENSSRDLWTQMQFLNPGLLGSANFFEKYYAQPIEKSKSETRSDKLTKLIAPLALRRTKEMVIEELPKSEVNILYCDMTKEQQLLYDHTKKLLKKTLFQNESHFNEEAHKNPLQILTCLQRLRQIAIHPQLLDPKEKNSGKYDALRFQLQAVFEQGSKVLIFSQFVKFLTLLKYDLIKEKIDFAYIDGSIKNRQAEVQKFQESESCKVFLLSLKAGGVGLNLTAANYVFIVDPWWNPAIENQAISRAHRIGQKNHVFAYKFITRNSIEEKIISLQKHKQQIADNLIRTDESFVKSLTKEDIFSLFD